MTDPAEIYLSPPCCSDMVGEGRLWCENDEWPEGDCGTPEEHRPATRYVRADIHEAALKRQAGAARTLQASTLETVRHLQERNRSEYTAAATLESEREANALLTAEIERLRAELERRTHPISPRLLPDADGYTCDMCGRVWGIGEISGCEPCRRAVEGGGDDG